MLHYDDSSRDDWGAGVAVMGRSANWGALHVSES